jgi:hypothetical protein
MDAGVSKRRWLIRAVDIAAVLFFGYGFGEFAWIIAHRANYNAPAASITPMDMRLWFINLPFFLFGLLWLIVRFARAYGVPYQALETRYPVLRQLVPIGIALGVGAIWGATVIVFSYL